MKISYVRKEDVPRRTRATGSGRSGGKYITPVMDLLNSDKEVIRFSLETNKEAVSCVSAILAAKRRLPIPVFVKKRGNDVYVIKEDLA